MNARKLRTLVPLILGMALAASLHAQTPADPADLPQRDGSHDFDFLIGNWKAHVRRLPDRLNNSSVWVEYNGISNHKKLLDSNANFEEFDVITTDKTLRIKAQTLRLYNPASRQWSIYLIDLDNGTLASPPPAANFSIRKTSKAAPFSCATSGSTSRPRPPAWNNPSPPTAARPGK